MATLDEYGSEKFKKVLERRARKELNEDSSQIQAHLTSFRRWINSTPHLSCITDDDFLLEFLRHAKYNHQKAQIRLDNYCTFRTSETLGRPDWFKEQEGDFDIYKKVLDMRMFCPFGMLNDGTVCTMVRLANYNFSVSNDKMTQLILRVNESLFLTEGLQICGVVLIYDFTGATAKQLKVIFSPTDSKDNTKLYQEAMPFRIKKLIFYNMPSFFDGLFHIVQHYLNPKIQSKVMVLRKTFEPAMEELPGLKSILPKEYGGKGKPYDEVYDKNRHLFEDAFLGKKDFKITVDESKRPSNARNLMKVYDNGCCSDFLGKNGTFVRLNDDEI